MGIQGCPRLLCIPKMQTWVGQRLSWVGLLPACGGSGWAGDAGAEPGSQALGAAGQCLGLARLCGAEPDTAQRRREPGWVPDPSRAWRGWQGGRSLVEFWKVSSSAAGDEAAFPPPAAVPAGGMVAETPSQGSDPRPLVLGRTVPKPPSTRDRCRSGVRLS